jgi:hypothetical protein
MSKGDAMRTCRLSGFLCVIALVCGCAGETGDDPTTADSGSDAGGNLDVTGIGDAGAGPSDAGAAPIDGAAGQVDTGVTAADSAGEQDVVTADADAGQDATPTCPGAVGCKCDKHADCGNGACTPTADTPLGSKGRCALPCESVDTCPTGTLCAKVSGLKGKFFCVQPTAKLCVPCQLNSECLLPGAPPSVCVSHGHEGGFCGVPCAADKACATGFECASVADVEGGKSEQCVPAAGAVCGCTSVGVALGTKTTCHAAKLPGCKAERKCVVIGGKPALEPCLPAQPAAEKCDGVDSDCDGQPDSSKLCDDSNPCTEDVCKGSDGCKHVADSLSPCDDGNACTVKDTCKGGKCAAQKAVCDDANSCTDDACDLAVGCTFTDNTKPCSDQSECTSGDVCLAGACTVTVVDCDDQKSCTADACSPVLGCKHTPAFGLCDDGNKCTQKDQCIDGNCKGGFAVSCGDGEVCTDDACDIAVGCTQTFNTSLCDDGDPCVLGERCAGGTCGGGKPRACDDGNACTNDPCIPVGALGVCGHVTTTDACNDGNACTTGDRCKDGKCGGKKLGCDDSNPCTTDACGMAKGCTHTVVTGPCEDGDKCTSGDTCAAGKCAGKKVDCDDKNPCTVNACDKIKGCVAIPEPATKACDDGKGCSGPDACVTGKCVGAVANCDDGNLCTNDACKPATGGGKPGCGHDANGAKCPDDDKCTVDEVCTGSVCKTKPNGCDDGNKCTTDSCQAGKGCVHAPIANCSTDLSVPFIQHFDCDSKSSEAWSLASSHGSKWAVDDSPATPLPYSPLCSLNFNNGKDYTCTVGEIDASAVSPWISTAKYNKGSTFVVSFALSGNWEGAPYDTLVLDYSDDGVTFKPLKSLSHSKPAVWTAIQVKVQPAGTKFKLRLRFGTQDCQFNDGPGPFIDDLAVEIDGCSKDVDCVGRPCSNVTCEVNTGKCAAKPLADGAGCGANDKCFVGKCKSGGCVADEVVTCTSKSPCETLSCAAKTGKCTIKQPNDGAVCDDGNPCTNATVCKATKCGSGPKTVAACDDKKPCTVDACAVKNGKPACTHTAAKEGAACDDGDACTTSSKCQSGKCTSVGGSQCTLKESFDCGGAKGWVLSPANKEPALGWHVDGTPATPGAYSPKCSLNFNNGKDYNVPTGVTKAYGHATSPVFTLPTGKSRLTFRSYHDVETHSAFDLRMVKMSADGFKTVPFKVLLSNATDPQKKWSLKDLLLPASLAGKKVQVRFEFDSKDNQSNSTTGWWVDDVQIVGG